MPRLPSTAQPISSALLNMTTNTVRMSVATMTTSLTKETMFVRHLAVQRDMPEPTIALTCIHSALDGVNAPRSSPME
eukprot:16219510-Heterocapsa_arctica.AAC.1